MLQFFPYGGSYDIQIKKKILTSQNGIYIYIYIIIIKETSSQTVALAQSVPRRATKVLEKYQYKRGNKMQALVDAQTKQWVRPPPMIM
jgi:hypothetical protein